MSIEITERTIGTWFLVLTDISDYMAGMEWETDEDLKAQFGNIKLTFRFRYYDIDNPEPWAGKDKKNWYSTVLKETTKQDAVLKFEKVLHGMEIMTGNKADEIINNGTPQEFIEKFTSMPWAHSKILSKEEAEKELGKKL